MAVRRRLPGGFVKGNVAIVGMSRGRHGVEAQWTLLMYVGRGFATMDSVFLCGCGINAANRTDQITKRADLRALDTFCNVTIIYTVGWHLFFPGFRKSTKL